MIQLPKDKFLKKFQTEILNKKLNSNVNHIYNACDMGLGKTVQAIVYAQSKNLKRVLVICPASLRLNWSRELKEWGTTNPFCKVLLSYKDSYDKESYFVKESENCYLILSYDLLVRCEGLLDTICSMHWDLLILDEAHYVRIPSTKRAKKVVALMKKVKNSLWLSGTPMMNTVMDLYIPLKLCLESREDVPPEHKLYLKNYNTFGAYFSHCRQTTFGKEYTGIRNPQILKEMINNNNFYYRLTKKEAELDLPDKTIQKIDLDFDVKTENTQEVETFLRSLENEKIPGLPPTHLTTMLRQLGEAKSTHSSAMEFIDNILEQGQPLVVFAYHKSVISNLYKYFKKYNPVVFDGSTSAEDKQKAVDDFQKGESQIFIGQIISAGTGITLTRASTCVFIEVTWLPSHITQAIDRLLRIGQKNAVIAYFLCTKNKVDERIIRAMVNKQKNIEKLL